MKTITICDKEWKIDGSAYIYIKYPELFKGRGIIKDINILKRFLIKQTITAQNLQQQNLTEKEIQNELSNFMMEDLDEFISAITRVTYALIYTADESVEDYETWLKNIKKLSIDDKWIVEVTEFAVDCFC